MKWNQWNRWIWRANGILIFLVGILGLFLGIAAGLGLLWEATRPRFTEATSTAPEVRETSVPRLGAFNALRGTPYRLASLYIEQKIPRGLYDKKSSSTHNLLFLNVDTGTMAWAFPKSDLNILSAESVEWNEVSMGVILVTVGEDTNNDGFLTRSDTQTLWFVPPKGSPVVELRTGLSGVTNYFLTAAERGFVVYSQNNRLWKAHFSLRPPKTESAEEVVFPPG